MSAELFVGTPAPVALDVPFTEDEAPVLFELLAGTGLEARAQIVNELRAIFWCRQSVARLVLAGERVERALTEVYRVNAIATPSGPASALARADAALSLALEEMGEEWRASLVASLGNEVQPRG